MANALFISWGLLPVVLGLGFIFTPKWMARLERAYARRVRRVQRRLIQANTRTGFSLIMVGMIMLITLAYPEWIYNFLFVTRVVAGALFPSYFVNPAEAETIMTTYWI